MAESLIENLRRTIQLNKDLTESGAIVLPVSLEGFWAHFLQDGSKLNWVEFWLQAMQAKDTMATDWSASDIPN